MIVDIRAVSWVPRLRVPTRVSGSRGRVFHWVWGGLLSNLAHLGGRSPPLVFRLLDKRAGHNVGLDPGNR